MGERFELAGKRVWVAGAGGMVGSALTRRLEAEPCVLVAMPEPRLDLRRQAETEAYIANIRPDLIFVAAARVGGIKANADYPADFLYDNLAIASNVIEAARRAGVDRLVFLGSSCVYPRAAMQPIREDALLSGPLEPTNQWYAVAKIAGLKLTEAYHRQFGLDYFTVQPCNLYGPGDNFSLETSHVLPALIRKAHQAKISGAIGMEVWGSGTPLREFLHVDDLADALVFLACNHHGGDAINVGSGAEITIADLARLVARIVGFDGELAFDPGRPDGTPRKVVDSSRIKAMGWFPKIALEEGIARTYRWLCEHGDDIRDMTWSGNVDAPVQAAG